MMHDVFAIFSGSMAVVAVPLLVYIVGTTGADVVLRGLMA